MRSSTQKRTKFLALAGMIAALYIALTYLAMAFGLDKNAIQVRFSEALCTMAVLTPAAIPGLFVGCLLANILTGCAALDIVLGSLATLIGALGAYFIGTLAKKTKKDWLVYLSPLPNVIINTLTVPFVVYICYTSPDVRNISLVFFYALTVFIGEIISAYILGMLFYFAMVKRKRFLK